MDLDPFYAAVAAINFTLLGLWLVVVTDRKELSRHDAASRRMAYLVSLQFAIPGTLSLLAQVAPTVVLLWRTAFTLAGIAGGVGAILLARQIHRQTGSQGIANLLRYVAVPAYTLVTLIAVLPPSAVKSLGIALTPLQLEAVLLSILVFLGAQEAWAVAMAPRPTDTPHPADTPH
ncbi:hypothetical protein [Catellatospora citrea]|uniref:Uncharacterized protein n=1 Tax=Catellatospora citrea TaxID=53366 RepID=A0A8J3KJR2_9ACTN|nr:hypothetical protein [Catellatospora citrea]RKE11666.1 hypothetical protein C8E86_6595 [Catellatospora citrea]GIG02195.1 hypothetical protein Cci01nite_72880 [Catellatospora citrea]